MSNPDVSSRSKARPIAARVAQGLGGAMVFAPSLALLAAVYEGAERRSAIATYAAIAKETNIKAARN